jgi:dihydropyrimidinase
VRALAEGKTAPIYHALTRPPVAEAEAVHRAIAMAEIAGAPGVHRPSLRKTRSTRCARRATAASRPLPRPARSTCCSPSKTSSGPISKAPSTFSRRRCGPNQHQPKLWDGLKHDHLQVVSTDHCPFCFADQKMLGKNDFTKIPNGGPGIENRLQLIYHHGVNEGKISLNRFVEITSTAPARIFGMYPKKGKIAPGSDADLVIWDPAALTPSARKTHHMRVDYSMFEGFPVRGNARTVLLARRR